MRSKSGSKYPRSWPLTVIWALLIIAYITTAGVESAPPLHCALQAMGSDRVLFSVDYPYQSAETATEFLKTVEIEPSVKEALASGNAARLLGV